MNIECNENASQHIYIPTYWFIWVLYQLLSRLLEADINRCMRMRGAGPIFIPEVDNIHFKAVFPWEHHSDSFETAWTKGATLPVLPRGKALTGLVKMTIN